MPHSHPKWRIRAQKMVDPVTSDFGGYAGVSHEDARSLLGSDFDELLEDHVRRHGPAYRTVYPWNVVDYLAPKLEREST